MITSLTRLKTPGAFSTEVRSAVCNVATHVLLGYRQQGEHLSKLTVLKLRRILQPAYRPALPRSGCGHDWLDTRLLNVTAVMLYKAVERLVLLHLSARSDADHETIVQEFNHLVHDLLSEFDETLALAA